MECIFCKIANKEMESKILYEDELCMVIMDVNPVVNGHALVIPKKHYTDYMELDHDIIKHIYEVAKQMAVKISNKLGASAHTLLVNYGTDQVVKHFHLHILPEFSKASIQEKMPVEEVFNILS